jgi:hypothetical protein
VNFKTGSDQYASAAAAPTEPACKEATFSWDVCGPDGSDSKKSSPSKSDVRRERAAGLTAARGGALQSTAAQTGDEDVQGPVRRAALAQAAH